VKAEILAVHKMVDKQNEVQVEHNRKLTEMGRKIDQMRKTVEEQKPLQEKARGEIEKWMHRHLERLVATDTKIVQLQTELTGRISQLERGVTAKIDSQQRMIEGVRMSVNAVGTSVSEQKGQITELQRQASATSISGVDAVTQSAVGGMSSSCSGTELFTFANYSLRKESSTTEESDPFYTHHEGYKLKLLITYYSDDIGAFLFLMKGEYDRQLQWPVEIRVRLEVLNQARDFRHVVKGATCTWKKTEKEKNRTIHDSLMKYATLERHLDAVQFMRNNCLKFKISVTVL
jgi:hypothetical protein